MARWGTTVTFLSCPIHRYPEIKQGWGCMFAFLRGPCNFNLGGWKIVKSWWCPCFLRVAHCSRRAHWCEAGIWSQHCWGAKPKLTTAQVGTAKWGLCFLYLSGWWLEHFLFFHILAIGIPTDFRFFRGVAQPPTSYDYRISRGFSTSDRFFRGFTMIYHVFSVGGTWVMKQALSGSWSLQLAPAKHIGSPYQRVEWAVYQVVAISNLSATF